MRIGVCAAVGKLQSFPAGLGFLEETVTNLLCPKEADTLFEPKLQTAQKSPRPVEAANIFIPGDLKTTGSDVDPAALDAYVTVVCRRAGKAGLRTIVFGSGGSRKVPDGFDRAKAADQIVDSLKRWGPIAQASGVLIALEPLEKAGCNIVNSVPEGAEIVRRVDHPSIRLLADTYHMGRDGEKPENLLEARGLLAHVHVAEIAGRRYVGATGEDHRPYFRVMKAIGYDGPVCMECKWNDLQAELPAAVEELRRQWEAA